MDMSEKPEHSVVSFSNWPFKLTSTTPACIAPEALPCISSLLQRSKKIITLLQILNALSVCDFHATLPQDHQWPSSKRVGIQQALTLQIFIIDLIIFLTSFFKRLIYVIL